MKGIGRRLDGWPNRDLDVGRDRGAGPEPRAVHGAARRRRGHGEGGAASWGPGKYDAELNQDGKAFRPDGKTGRDPDPGGVRPGRVRTSTRTRAGARFPYWNAYVANTADARAGHVLRSAAADTAKFPVAARGRLRATSGAAQDLITPQAGGAALLPAGDPAPRSRPKARSTRPRPSAARRCSTARPAAPAATCRRCSPSRAGRCTPARRSASTISRPTARRTAVPHHAAARAVRARQGRLLPRRPLRRLRGGRRPLRSVLQARARRNEKTD